MTSFLRCLFAAFTVLINTLAELEVFRFKAPPASADARCERFMAAVIVSRFLLRLAAVTALAKGLALIGGVRFPFIFFCFLIFFRLRLVAITDPPVVPLGINDGGRPGFPKGQRAILSRSPSCCESRINNAAGPTNEN